MFALLVQDLHWANTEGLKLVYENDLSWTRRIRSFLMCSKTIKTSKILDEIANTQCGPEIFCICEVIINIPWYHFSQIDIFRGIRKISVNISSDTSFTRSNIVCFYRLNDQVDYNVEKWSDSTHATRTLVSHLHKLNSEKKSNPGDFSLSPKVIDYFRKCFSFCLNQNKGDPQKMKISLAAIVPHAFGDHSQCKENNLSWCAWQKNPETYKHKDLPNGSDLKGENLKIKLLTDLFKVYSSDLVINKIVENASSQANESLHSTVGSKVPKIRFYSGSESTDQRIAAAVAQTNLGKQYLTDTL